VDYVTFLLDLSGEGDNRSIRETVAYRRTLKLRPKNAFQWKVTCDIHGKIYVAGLVRGKARILASARWHAGVLAEHKHRDPTTPTGYQWNLVEVALREELARRAGMHDRSGEPPITRDQQVEDDVGLDAELVEPPPEVFAPYNPAREVDEAKQGRAERERALAQRQRRNLMIALGGGGAVLAIAILVFAITRTRFDKPTVVAQAVAPPAPLTAPTPMPAPPDAAPEPIEVRIAKAATFTEAVALAKPAMTDTTDELGGGTKLFATYAAAKLRWGDVDVPAETTVAHVLKDPDVERGKRMCVDGVIATIERRDLERRKVYVGSLRLADGDGVAFVAVGTTGELVKRNPARFCGAVIGKAGSVASMVGMFDLPENRTPIVEQ